MKLNREQAIGILERFDFFQGQRAGRELWNDKPYEVQEQDITAFSRDVTLLIDYIKELTEENERLKAENDRMHKAYYEIACEVEDLREENERLKDDKSYWKKRAESRELEHDKAVKKGYAYAKADTVRKMQDMLTTFFRNDETLEYSEVNADYINEQIDQIAKELLEETK